MFILLVPIAFSLLTTVAYVFGYLPKQLVKSPSEDDKHPLDKKMTNPSNGEKQRLNLGAWFAKPMSEEKNDEENPPDDVAINNSKINWELWQALKDTGNAKWKYLAFMIVNMMLSFACKMLQVKAIVYLADGTMTQWFFLLYMAVFIPDTILSNAEHLVISKLIIGKIKDWHMITFFKYLVLFPIKTTELNQMVNEIVPTIQGTDRSIQQMVHAFCRAIRLLVDVVGTIFVTFWLVPEFVIGSIIVWSLFMLLYGFKQVVKNGHAWTKMRTVQQTHSQYENNAAKLAPEMVNAGADSWKFIIDNLNRKRSEDIDKVNYHNRFNDVKFQTIVGIMLLIQKFAVIAYIAWFTQTIDGKFVSLILTNTSNMSSSMARIAYTWSHLNQIKSTYGKEMALKEKLANKDNIDELSKASPKVQNNVRHYINQLYAVLQTTDYKIWHINGESGTGKSWAMEIFASSNPKRVHHYRQEHDLKFKGLTVQNCLTGGAKMLSNDELYDICIMCGLEEHPLDKKMTSPSGGENQRLGLGAWFAFLEFAKRIKEGDMIFLDELSNHLDSWLFSRIINHIAKKYPKCHIVITTHCIGDPVTFQEAVQTIQGL